MWNLSTRVLVGLVFGGDFRPPRWKVSQSQQRTLGRRRIRFKAGYVLPFVIGDARSDTDDVVAAAARIQRQD